MEHVRRAWDSNVDHETAESTESSNHPWNDLTTITTFDQGTGNNMRSTFRLNNDNGNETNGEITPATKSQQPQVTQGCTVLIETLIRQLCAVLEMDEARRQKLYHIICKKLHDLQLINIYDTVEFEELRRQYQHSFYQMFSIACGEPERNTLMPRSLVPKLSRYCEEFEEISFIARGGFGEVYKARHRLDRIEYAIKKITMPADRIEIIQQQLNEVRALARLNHTNIVSYNAAWIETSSYNSSVASAVRKLYKSPKHQRKESKSYNSLINDLFSNNGTKVKKRNVYRNGNINHDIISERFEELNSSVYVTEKKVEKNKEEYTEKSSSDVVSFRNSKTNEKNQEKYTEESSSDVVSFRNSKSNQKNQEKYTEESSSDVVSFRNSKSNEKNQEYTEESSSDVVSFRNSKSNEKNQEGYTEESNSDVMSFRNNKSNENIDKVIDSDTGNDYSYKESSSTSKEVCTYTESQPRVTLYIQMSLCEQTLEQWLRGRISVTPEPIGKVIFQQILCGVDYMHSQKIVHHDIKPSNIFISTSGQIQLGDFGLACPLQIGNQHSVVGTRMYSAPEQLLGKCDPKSDIYSIGVVLIELLILIKTQMELCSIINSLKSGQIPEALKQHKWAQMVKQLVQKDPAKRPTTSQLLQNFSDEKDVIINGLQNIIVDLVEDNCVKDDTIQELNEEIALLKEKVRKLSTQQTDNTTN